MDEIYSFCFRDFGYFMLRADGSMFYWSNKTDPDDVSDLELNLKKKYPNLIFVRAHKYDSKSNLYFNEGLNRLGSNPAELLDLWTWNFI